MNVVMALLWVATGAALLGLATTIAGRRRGAERTGMVRAGLVSLGAFFACCFWLVIPPVHATSTTIDSARPVDVTCDPAWTALRTSSFVETDVGPTFSPAGGACRAAAWQRVASLGSAEVGMALFLGTASVLLVRRRTDEPRRETDRSTI